MLKYCSQCIGNTFQPSGNDTGDWDDDWQYQKENASYTFDGIVSDGKSSPKFEDTPKDKDEN